MAGSTRTFSYTLTPRPEDTDQVAGKARKILSWACEGDNRITCHEIQGEALGRVTLSLTIVGRDQWWCRQLAQDIVNLVSWSLANPAQLDLRSDRQKPHQNRGYRAGRRKTWREPREVQ